MSKIRVLIADDHPVFLQGLSMVLALNGSEIELVGSAADGEEAVRKAMELRPEVVLLDIRMPGMDGVEAARRMRSEIPGIKIIMLTTFDDRDLITGAMRAGANGYMLKDMTAPQIVQAIQTVYQGNVLISPQVAEKLCGVEGEDISGTEDALAREELKKLTKREREILMLMADGEENMAIADRLYISERTVRNYVSQIYQKLGVHSRTQAVVRALHRTP